MEKQLIPAGYKQTEFGVIPEDWKVSTIGSEFEVKLGKMLDADKNIGIEKPYLGNKSVQWGFIDVQNLPTMRMTPTDLKAFRLNVGDLLVCEGGEVGRSAIWEGEIEECYYQKALHRLRSLHGFKPSLMSAYFRYWTDHRLIDDYVSQTSIAHLTREKLISIPLPIPSAPEQTAIANALSDVDALIAALEKLINKKSAIKTAAMQQLLTGKKRLPPFDQLNTGYKQTELGEIPGDWEVRTINELNFDLSDGNYSSKYPRSDEFKPMGIPFIRANNIKMLTIVDEDMRFISEEKHSEISKGHLKEGDVLITNRGEIGNLAIVPNRHIGSNINAQIVRINTNGTCVINRYFAYYLQKDEVKQKLLDLQTGSALKQLPVNRLKTLGIVIPSKEEQAAIANVLSDMDKDLEALQQRLHKTQQIKQGMMQELLTGKTRLVQPIG